MKCKFCLAEIEDDVTVCPLCGKELEVSAEEEILGEEETAEKTETEEASPEVETV